MNLPDPAGQDVELRGGTDVWATRFASSFRMMDLRPSGLDPQALALLPLSVATRHKAVAVGFEPDGGLVVAIADPTDLNAIDAVQLAVPAGIQVHLRAADPVVIDACLNIAAQVAATDAEAGTRAELELQTLTADTADEDDVDADGPVAKLVEDLLELAVARGASDIHFEPDGGFLLVKLRIDSVLREHSRVAAGAARAVVRRVKVMANMDIADRLRFQDGRFDVRLHGRSFDARAVCLPTPHGESLVIRLFDTGRSVKRLTDVGLADYERSMLEQAVAMPHGLILVCGPTGSGKTTTLHSALGQIAGGERKILTVEDPVEIQMPGVVQVQVNETVGVTFASALRSFLRSDPDVMLVGEIRDAETARLAVQAAQTGHLVLSTLHTNSAVAAPARLADLGAQPWLIADTLRVVLAQRLVRRLCIQCARPSDADEATVQMLAEHEVEPSGVLRIAGDGCGVCENTGYRGMIAVGELVHVTAEISALIAEHAGTAAIAAAAAKAGTRSLARNAAGLVAAGITDIAEVRRVGL